MDYERVFLTYLVRNNLTRDAVERQIADDFFSAENTQRSVWQFTKKFYLTYQTSPTEDVLRAEFPAWTPEVADVSFDWLCDKLRERWVYNEINHDMRRITQAQANLRPYESLEIATSMVARLGDSARKALDVSWTGTTAQRRAHYEAVRDRGGLVGIPCRWDSLTKVTGGMANGQFWVITARPSVGKCVAGGTPIYNPSTGLHDCIEDVVRNQSDVLTVQATGDIIRATPTCWLNTGEKETIRITLRSGRTLTGTPEHPVMTPDGWERLDSVCVGTFVKTVRQLPEPSAPWLDGTDPESLVIGAILAEGMHRSHNGSEEVCFTNSDPEIVQVVSDAVSSLGAELSPVSGSCIDYRFRWVGGGSKWDGPNPVVQTLRKWGVTPSLATEKHIPDAVYRLPSHRLAKVLGMYWSCDGSVESSGALTCSSASKDLVQGIQNLLLRFGITSRIRYKQARCNDKVFDAWELRVYSTCRGLFKESIPLIGIKATRLASLPDVMSPNVDGVPLTPTTRARIRRACDRLPRRGGQLYTMASALGVQCFDLGKLCRRRFVTRRVLSVLNAQCGGMLTDLLNCHWDEIKGIESTGVQRVYDLSISDTHCFVANNVVVHNTWVETILAHYAHKQRYRVLFFSKEMAHQEIFERLDAVYAKVPFQDLRRGQLPGHLEKMFFDSLDVLAMDPVELWCVSDDEGQGVSGIDAKIARYHPDIVFIDGLYLTSDDLHGRGRVEQLANISRAVKLTARRRNIPIIASSQLNRDAEGDKKKGDNLGSIAWGDALAQDADIVIELFQNKQMRESVPQHLFGATTKFRQGGGAQWRKTVTWDMENMNFEELPDAEDMDNAPVRPAVKTGDAGVLF